MADPLVCNINFFLYTRFVFGFYHELQTSKTVRWLAKCYCCFMCACIIIMFNSLFYTGIYAACIIRLISAEYVLYVLFSLLKGNEYLINFFKKTPLLETRATNYKPMRVRLMIYMCLIFLIRGFSIIKTILLHRDITTTEFCFCIIDFIMWFAILLGRLPLLFVFAVLYTRVRLMRQTLEGNNFDCRNQGQHHPRRYIQMYEAIMDGLEETNNSLKLQILVFSVIPIAYYLMAAFYFLYYLKDFGSIYGITYTLEMIWFLMEAVLGCSPLFLSAVLADLVTMEVQDMLAITVERGIDCTNERDRAEIQKLFQLMTSHPFKFTLCGVVSLNVRSVLSFASFTITTFIAILQTKQWSA